ncbi:hypothetical protein JB92DRAFT_2147329 [Gautieria morchelliformis]|nr:hypothetical protein JB92DRAFT_2147329 [Gautieria morchelliformis]
MDDDSHLSDEPGEPQARPGLRHTLPQPASAADQSSEFDFNMRRHSIAEHPLPHRAMPHADMPRVHSRAPGVPSLPHGLKRKISQERVLYPMGEEDMDVSHPPVMPDIEGPAPKRRSSAFDTHRIAQLSLYDRRDSVDARVPAGQAPQWWMQDRRDSTSSMFSNTSIGSAGYSSSAFSGDSAFPARAGLANMAWPPPHPSGPATNHEADPPMSGLPRHLQARGAGPSDASTSPFPPVPTAMPPDRRMSVPEVSTAAHSQHGLRSKSRPSAPPAPSHASDRQPSTNPSEGDAVAEESEPSPTQGQLLHPSGSLKDSASPYSRSPELRVSHKLAERKRRKEMKELFDELRDQLPADRGMKASKWEILTKAVDYIHTLKTNQQEMSRELEMLRHEVESSRSNTQFQQSAGANHAATFGAGGVPVGSPFAHPPGLPPHPPPDSTSTT